MQSFLRRFAPVVMGALSCLDKVRFRGAVRWLAKPAGMMHFLWKVQVLLKDFPVFAKDTTATLRTAMEQAAIEQGRPVEYLASKIDKEKRAQEIAQRDGVKEGLVAVFTCVEPCMTYRVYGVRETKKLALKLELSKCLHYYHYYLDPKIGWMHTRQQTWFPFTNMTCLNGHEWLARQMDAAGLGYERRDNCFAWLEDVDQAQALAHQQLRTDWSALLEKLARRSNPLHGKLFSLPLDYYWSAETTEWASDFMFRSQKELAQWMPTVIKHGMLVLGSADVMRYLGHPIPGHGGVNGHFQGEVITDFKRRPEGARVKHQVKKNWIKLYDKQGTVLRIETVINDVEGMKSYRAKENDPAGPKDWRKMRKGVADLHRRVEISQSANERYADSFARVEESTTLKDLAEPVCRRVTWQGRSVRALNPLSKEDAALLEAVNAGTFMLHGFRNRDIRELLYGEPKTEQQGRRESSSVTRQMRMLRAHGVIEKIRKENRYKVTDSGRQIIAALLTARAANTQKLLEAA